MERAVYRIIDANFNRAREASRVIEEFCRFALDSAILTERAKQLRHELSAAVGKIDTGRRIAVLCGFSVGMLVYFLQFNLLCPEVTTLGGQPKTIPGGGKVRPIF